MALFGSLAPKGAILKRAAADPRLFEREGRAVVFTSLDDLAARIDAPDLDVTPDDFLLLQNAGPRSGVAMPEAGYLPIPMKLARAGVKDMVRISDARMSGTAYGTIILHVSPEAAVAGPLAFVRNGDRIRSVAERRWTSWTMRRWADVARASFHRRARRSAGTRGSTWARCCRRRTAATSTSSERPRLRLGQQRLDERARGRALPAAWPHGAPDQPPLPVDEVHGGRSPHSVHAAGDVTAFIEEHGRRVAALLRGLSHEIGILAEIDEPHLEALALQLLVQAIDGRQLFRQSGHHVAQKNTITTLPRRSSSRWVRPWRSGSAKAGAGLGSG